MQTDYKEKIDQFISELGVSPTYKNGKKTGPLAVVKLGDDNLIIRINGELTERTKRLFKDEMYFKITKGHSQYDIQELKNGASVEDIEKGKETILGDLYTIESAVEKVISHYCPSPAR